jgi:hypothetical protein
MRGRFVMIDPLLVVGLILLGMAFGAALTMLYYRSGLARIVDEHIDTKMREAEYLEFGGTRT